MRIMKSAKIYAIVNHILTSYARFFVSFNVLLSMTFYACHIKCLEVKNFLNEEDLTGHCRLNKRLYTP